MSTKRYVDEETEALQREIEQALLKFADRTGYRMACSVQWRSTEEMMDSLFRLGQPLPEVVITLKRVD